MPRQRYTHSSILVTIDQECIVTAMMSSRMNDHDINRTHKLSYEVFNEKQLTLIMMNYLCSRQKQVASSKLKINSFSIGQ